MGEAWWPACRRRAPTSHAVSPDGPEVTLWLLSNHNVSLTESDRRTRPGLVVHHGLEPREITLVDGIPATTVLRTLQDLGHPDRLVREALARGLCRPEDLRAA